MDNDIISNQNDTKQLRIFISNINSVLGQEMVETFRNDHENETNHHIIIGTLDEDDETPIPRGVKKIIDTKNMKEFLISILDCDIIIYDGMNTNLDEVHFIIKSLEEINYLNEKIFIFITNALIWGDTPSKLDSENFGFEDISKLSKKSNEESINTKDRPKFDETDYMKRRPLPCYEPIRQMEDLVLSCGEKKKNFQSFVLSTGIIYGNGEDMFYDFFDQALKGESIKVIEPKKNIIPTIHVRDLCNYIYQIMTNPNDYNKYLILTDKIENTQLEIANCITSNIGNGELEFVNPMDAIFEDDFNLKYINVNLKCSEIIKNNLENDSILKSENEFKIKIEYENGLVNNFDKLFAEFKLYRNIKTKKIILLGTPGSGKTLFAKHIANELKLNYLSIPIILEELNNTNNEISNEIKNYLQTEKTRLLTEAREQLEKDKAKKKKGLPESIEEDQIKVRLPSNLIQKIVKWKLKQSKCINIGYILDGFPLNYNDCKEIFTYEFIENIKNEEELNNSELKDQSEIINSESNKILNEAEVFEIEKDIIPEHVIFLDSNIDNCKEINGENWDETRQTRRFNLYNENIEQLKNFFIENNIEIKNIDLNENNNKNDILKIISEYLEENLNLIEVKELNKEIEESDIIKDEEVNIENNKTDDSENIVNSEKEIKEEELRDYTSENLKAIIEEEEKILKNKSQALRQYITDNILPYLTESLIEICKNKPENPVDILSKMLMEYSKK